MNEQYMLVINAGGQSRRMGQPKALLSVPPHGRPLLETIVQRLQPLTPHAIIVIANDPALRQQSHLGNSVRWCVDTYPDVGPLGGLATALMVAPAWVIVVACDMPLLNPALLRYLVSCAEEADASGGALWDAVVPVVNDRPEPLHALYHRRCLAAVTARLAADQRRATAFLPDIRVRYVHEEELRRHDAALYSFLNVNTPEEWAQIQPLLAAFR
jgi:molybdopterin-guanine dinucleotide biosynthesis protein A